MPVSHITESFVSTSSQVTIYSIISYVLVAICMIVAGVVFWKRSENLKDSTFKRVALMILASLFFPYYFTYVAVFLIISYFSKASQDSPPNNYMSTSTSAEFTNSINT
jgi:cation transport ATPase